MSLEIIDNITTARELRDILNATPDYLLDVPITIGHDGHNLMFEATRVEVLDIIEDGARAYAMTYRSGKPEIVWFVDPSSVNFLGWATGSSMPVIQ